MLRNVLAVRLGSTLRSMMAMAIVCLVLLIVLTVKRSFNAGFVRLEPTFLLKFVCLALIPTAMTVLLLAMALCAWSASLNTSSTQPIAVRVVSQAALSAKMLQPVSHAQTHFIWTHPLDAHSAHKIAYHAHLHRIAPNALLTFTSEMGLLSATNVP